MFRQHWKTIVGFVALAALLGILVLQLLAPKQPVVAPPVIVRPSVTVTPGQPEPTSSDNQLAPGDPEVVRNLPNEAELSEVVSLAAKFTRAYLNTSKPADRWLSDLKPLTESAFAGQLASVDPGNIPPAKVTGTPKTGDVSRFEMVMRVPTSTGTITLHIYRAGAIEDHPVVYAMDAAH